MCTEGFSTNTYTRAEGFRFMLPWIEVWTLQKDRAYIKWSPCRLNEKSLIGRKYYSIKKNINFIKSEQHRTKLVIGRNCSNPQWEGKNEIYNVLVAYVCICVCVCMEASNRCNFFPCKVYTSPYKHKFWAQTCTCCQTHEEKVLLVLIMCVLHCHSQSGPTSYVHGHFYNAVLTCFWSVAALDSEEDAAEKWKKSEIAKTSACT